MVQCRLFVKPAPEIQTLLELVHQGYHRRRRIDAAPLDLSLYVGPILNEQSDVVFFLHRNGFSHDAVGVDQKYRTMLFQPLRQQMKTKLSMIYFRLIAFSSLAAAINLALMTVGRDRII